MTGQGRYVPEVDSFTLIGTSRDIPSVNVSTDQELPKRLGLGRETFAATVLIRLADEPAIPGGSVSNDELAIESDSRVADLDRAMTILSAARDALITFGEATR